MLNKKKKILEEKTKTGDCLKAKTKASLTDNVL